MLIYCACLAYEHLNREGSRLPKTVPQSLCDFRIKLAIKTAAAISILAGSLAFSGVTQAADTIKVGVLHSLSGTMAISETALKDVVLFTQTICNVIT